jgi:hypothetical protein
MTPIQSVSVDQVQVVDTPTGTQVVMPCIHSVGIDNLCEVISHDINRLLGSTSHVVRLTNGGYLNLAYTSAGEVLVLEGYAIRLSISPEGHVAVGIFNANGV